MAMEAFLTEASEAAPVCPRCSGPIQTTRHVVKGEVEFCVAAGCNWTRTVDRTKPPVCRKCNRPVSSHEDVKGRVTEKCSACNITTVYPALHGWHPGHPAPVG